MPIFALLPMLCVCENPDCATSSHRRVCLNGLTVFFRQASRTRFATVSMEYDARGSSYGKSRIKGSEPPVPHYAGSDSLLTDEEYERHPDLQMFPSLAG